MKFTSISILIFLFIATGLSFLDRQVLSMTIIQIQKEFHITDVQYGWVNTSFLISYALMFTIGGRLMDLVGGKIGLAVSLAVWSVAIGLHGFMTGFFQLLLFRFFLGVGEGGCFPGAAKIVHDWFDEKRRAAAMGIAIGGSAIGAVVAPPLVTWVSDLYGWRWSFISPAVVGIIWVVLWMSVPWKNSKHSINYQDKKYREKVPPLMAVLKNKKTLVFILVRFLVDPVFYFIMFWAPKYLSEQRDISFEKIGSLFWIPFLGLGIANMLGGWFSDKLLKSGRSVDRSRKTIMGIAAAATVIAPLIASVSSVQMAIALMTVVLIAHGFWITNYITAISDVFGSHATSTVVGVSGTAGALSGLLVSPLIGYIVQHYSYTPLWIVVGFIYPLAFVLLVIFIPKLIPVSVTTR